MSVRMRHTSSHTKNRRSHHALKDGALVKDKESGALRLPHRLDASTGMYRGKQIVSKDAIERRAKRAERKENQKRDTSGFEVRQPIHSDKEENKQEIKKEGVLGRLTKGRSKTRSGLGGGGS